jgi:SAM-dependent methyltransferase
LTKHGIKPKSALSLACGNGRAERDLISSGVVEGCHGVDISEKAIEEARSLAEANNYPITYEQCDLNHIQLGKDKYDLVVTQNCLHHILRLEHLAEEISGSLRAGGVLWIHDFVGETQFQWTNERLDIVNRVMDILPDRFKYRVVDGKSVNNITRRQPGKLVSPFEAIRSSEIIPIFSQHFDIVEKTEFNSILRFTSPLGTRSAYAKNEDSRAIFELTFLLDRLLLEYGVLPPCGGKYLMRKK